MANILTNQDLRTAFTDQMAASGTPVERVAGHHAANQLYRITAGKHSNKTLRLRTNKDYAVMSLAEATDFDAVIPSLVDVDFVGITCVNRGGNVECYLVPAARLIADMQAGHRRHTEGLGRPSGSRVRILYFADKAGREWQGYAKKYAEFHLHGIGKVSLDQAKPKAGADVIERARRMVGEAFGVPPSAVKITIEMAGREAA